MAETTRTTALDFVGDTIDEVKKVTWPDKEELQSSTGIIILFMFLCAGVILVMDMGVSGLLRLLTSLVS